MNVKEIFQKVKKGLKMEGVPKGVRRVIVAIVGGTVLLIGMALIVLPGPAFVVIPIGLAILGSEFAWARFYMNKARKAVKTVKEKIQRHKAAAAK